MKKVILTSALLLLLFACRTAVAFIGCESSFEHVIFPLKETGVSITNITAYISKSRDIYHKAKLEYVLENRTNTSIKLKVGMPYKSDAYSCSEDVVISIDETAGSFIIEDTELPPEIIRDVHVKRMKTFEVFMQPNEVKRFTIDARFFSLTHPLKDHFLLDTALLALWRNNKEKTNITMVLEETIAKELPSPMFSIFPENYALRGNRVQWDTHVSKIMFSSDYTRPEPKASPGNTFIGSIVFEKAEMGFNIFRIDGARPDRVTPLTQKSNKYRYGFRDPTWINDGAEIAFIGEFDMDHSEILIMNADGSNKRQVTSLGGRVSDLHWVEREKQLFFKLTKERHFHKPYVLDLRTMKAAPSDKTIDTNKIWSQDGSRYVIGTWQDTNIYDKNGKLIKKLDRDYAYATLSPTGRSLMYCIMCGSEGSVEQLHILDIDTGRNFLVARGHSADWFFKPDDALLFVTDIFKLKNRTYDGNLRAYSREDIAPLNSPTKGSYERLYSKALRNEMFARHGREFKSLDLRYIFESTDWYKPNPNYSNDMLNDIEKKNIQFILDYEKKMGWR